MIISPNVSTIYQKDTLDPYPFKKKEGKIYHTINYQNWSSIKIYNNFDSFKKQNYDELRLPINGNGTNWTELSALSFKSFSASFFKLFNFILTIFIPKVSVP